ncbi:ATP F0F1 synthase subunit B' [Meridianimarinicoccus roseus]|jgi:F-type H+-transporting ATPase subunit b|uniref:ATP synthase subunit b n=1 Tax=Meridianimarinicoccus roseus TaxID=2072018 RepID=A0A2V2LGR2_9RHOB|nr:F0F1 ATP synthase subunit B' [Meridianimarinicoccus roseus]PWR01579.1 ATP F0F1 synthase subunit B' [Meridianimarinicoccus roseus]
MADNTQAAHGADAAHGAAAAGHAADAPGMPQLDFGTFPNQIFWLIVALVAIYFILSKVALPRIAGILADRQDTITNDIAAAEELKLKAKQAEAAYEKALADARSEATRIANDTKAAMQADLNEAIEKADAEISARAAESEKAIAEIRASALESVEAVAKDTTGALVAALGGQADEGRINAAVDARLKG